MKNKNKFPNTHRAVSPRPAKKRTRVVSETLWKTTEYFCESAVIFFEPFSSTNSQMYYTKNFRRINCLSLASDLLKRILIIHDENTKEITTVKKVWICCGAILSLVQILFSFV